MKLEDAIRRIQKCLALGASSNEHEAAAAMRQAQKLMAEYNVSPEHVGQVVIEMHSAKSTACTKPPLWEQGMAVAIAKAFGCEIFVNRGWFDSVRNKNGEMAQYRFVGPKAQAMTAAWTMDMMRTRIVAGRVKHMKDGSFYSKRDQMASGNTWAEGFVAGVRAKVEAFAGNSPETEAAMVKMLEDKLGCKKGEAKPVKATNRAQGSSSDYYAGRDVGEKTSLHRPISGAAPSKGAIA